MGLLSALTGTPSMSSMVGSAMGAKPNPLAEILSGIKLGVSSGPFNVAIQGEDPNQAMIKQLMLRQLGGMGGMGGAPMGSGGNCIGGQCTTANSIKTNPETHSPTAPSVYKLPRGAGPQMYGVNTNPGLY